MKNFIFYSLTVLIWGTTWIGIKFQLGQVDPMVSVAYRFALAAGLLQLYCRLTGLPMRFTRRDHFFMALQGVFLFAVNYWLFYISELYLASGLVALIFSTIVFLNILNGALFLRSSVSLRMLVGAVLGLVGISLVFLPELRAFQLNSKSLYGLLLGLLATYLASLGNIISAYNQQKRLPVIQTNAFGMLYGAIIMIAMALISGRPFGFVMSPGYIVSLLYLAVFGSIVAFGCYLTLVGRIGADRAAYATLLFPLVALVISTIFEGYQWSGMAALGVVVILIGNLIIVHRRTPGQSSDQPRRMPICEPE